MIQDVAQQQSPGGGGINISFPEIDWTKLIPQIFEVIGKWFDQALHDAFDGVWSSSANVVGQTDIGLTWGFGPIHDQVASIQTAVRAILIFALILLGLKSMLGAVVRSHSDVIGEFVNGVLMSVILVTAFPLIIPEVINLTNAVATAVGKANLAEYVTPGGLPNPILQGVLFIILLFFGGRLLMKCIWRMGFLAVLLPFGLLACALYAIPQTRWILGWWSRVWGGMLLAQIPSVMALSIGVQSAGHGAGGVGSFFYAIAFMQLATDLYSFIPFGSMGGGGAPWGSLPWRAASAITKGGSGAASAASSAAWPAGATAGHMAGMYGYQ